MPLSYFTFTKIYGIFSKKAGEDKVKEERIISTTGLNNCGGRCLLRAHVKDGKIIRMSTQTAAETEGTMPLTACPKGLKCHETFLGADRITQPMKRVGERGEGRFEEISWDEALDIITREWVRIRDAYGPSSRYVNYATGMAGLISGCGLARRLLALDGGYLGRYNSYSSACITQMSNLMYGTTVTGNSPESWLDSSLIILWGHNPAESRFDCASMYYLEKAKAKGIPIIVVDPRRSATVERLSAEWIPIKPATDAAMLDAMAYVIYSEGLHDSDFLSRCCIGFDGEHMPEGIDSGESYLSYLLGEKDGIVKTPQWAEKICAVPAKTIENLALRYAKAKPAALIQGLGAQRHAYGEQSARGGILLACMTGNVGVWGGWACGNGFYKGHENPVFPSPPNPFHMSIPAFCWTEAVLRGHEMKAIDGVRGGEKLPSDIKMIINLAGNCLINQHSDINRTAEILRDTSKCEFIVCSDLFMTASARFADILLPGVSPLEQNNISMPWQYGDFLGFAPKIVESVGQCRFEYDWLCEIAERLGLGEAFSEGRSADEWLEYIYNDLRTREKELPEYEEFSKGGVYVYKNNEASIAFEKQCRDPEKYPFSTPSGKIELFSKEVYITEYQHFFPAIPRYVEPPEGINDPLAEKYPLQLIGWHTMRRAHSIHDNNPSLEKIEPHRLWINPKDAEKRGIDQGNAVIIRNDRGVIRAKAHITDKIMEGVTALSQGAWYKPNGQGEDEGGCINTLTSLRPTPYARGNPQHTNLVEVEKCCQ